MGVGPLVKHLAGSTAGTVALPRGSTGCEDAAVSMVGDITRGTAVNQSFSDVLNPHACHRRPRDYRTSRFPGLVASNGRHFLDGPREGEAMSS